MATARLAAPVPVASEPKTMDQRIFHDRPMFKGGPK